MPRADERLCLTLVQNRVFAPVVGELWRILAVMRSELTSGSQVGLGSCDAVLVYLLDRKAAICGNHVGRVQWTREYGF